MGSQHTQNSKRREIQSGRQGTGEPRPHSISQCSAAAMLQGYTWPCQRQAPPTRLARQSHIGKAAP